MPGPSLPGEEHRCQGCLQGAVRRKTQGKTRHHSAIQSFFPFQESSEAILLHSRHGDQAGRDLPKAVRAASVRRGTPPAASGFPTRLGARRLLPRRNIQCTTPTTYARTKRRRGGTGSRRSILSHVLLPRRLWKVRRSSTAARLPSSVTLGPSGVQDGPGCRTT